MTLSTILNPILIESYKDELTKGIEVEMEHANTRKWLQTYLNQHKTLPSMEEIAKHIALDHLDEDPLYYKKLAVMEKS